MLLDQINHLRNNLRQVRQSLNSVMGQVNQQLTSSEQIVQNIGNQLMQRTGGTFGAQFGTTQFGGSQYQPTQQWNQMGAGQLGATGQFGAGQTLQQNWGARSQYNPENVASSQRGGGINQFGAQYSSGNRDEDIGQSYYQATQGGQFMGSRSQYNPGAMTGQTTGAITGQFGTGLNLQQTTGTKSQYNLENVASSERGGGVNRFGAQYSSGNRDEDIGQSYYQSKQMV